MKKIFTKALALVAMLAMTLSASAEPFCEKVVTSTVDYTSLDVKVTVTKKDANTARVILDNEHITGIRAGGTFQQWGNGVWEDQSQGVANFSQDWTHDGTAWYKDFVFSTYPTTGVFQIYILMDHNAGTPAVAGFTLASIDVDAECSGGSECTDAVKPEITAVAVGNLTDKSAVLTITASDNESITNYIVKNGDTQIKTSATSPITLTDLTAGTTYSNIKVIAKDACGNESEAFVVAEFTTEARQSQCSGDLGHFGSPSVKRISYTIEYLPGSDKIRYTIQGYDTQVLDYLEIQTTSGNSGAVTITDGVAVWNQAAPAAGTEIGILFLYSTDAIGGNEMNAESCSIDKEGIVYYKSHDCESSEPEPEPEEIYNVNFALKSNGASATAKSGNNAEEAIDNNTGSRWYSATDGLTDEQKNDQWWQVDLGERRIFNLVQILWEGAYGKSFDIQKSNDGTNWTTIKEVRNQTITGPFPYLQEIELEANDTARFVRFQGIARGTGYAYSFWEFRVFLVGERVLTSLELNAAQALSGTNPKVALAPTEGGLNITVTGRDQIGCVIDAGEIEYQVSPEDAGEVVAGKFVPANIGGSISLTAKNGTIVSNTIAIYGYTGENLSLGKEVEASSADATNTASKAVDNDEGSLWSAFSAETADRVYDAWIVVDLAAYYDINLIAIRWEGACSKTYHVDFSEDKETWRTAYEAGWNAIATHWEYLFGTTEDAKKVRYVRIFSTEAVSNYGIKIMEIKVFGTPYVPTGDNEKPVMGLAELVSKTWNSAVIAVSATDNEEIGKYHVVDATNEFDDTFVASAEGKITVTGLKPSTTYNFTITVLDLSENESENSAILPAFTTESHLFAPDAAATTPTVAAAQVLGVYGDTYSATCSYDAWGSGATFEDDTYGKKCIGANGWFGLVNFGVLDCTDMEKLHADIWVENNASLRITPILQYWDSEDPEPKWKNYPEYGEIVNLNGQQWNSIDLVLSKGNLASNIDWTHTYQVKFDQVAGLTFWLNNVYFFTTKADPTAIDNANANANAVKRIENGQLIIIKNGIRYNVAGQLVK